MPNLLHTCILNIYDFFGFYGISTLLGYLMPNPLHTSTLNIKDLFGFYGISTILCYLIIYLMQNLHRTDISNIYDLVWLGFMAYQPFYVI